MKNKQIYFVDDNESYRKLVEVYFKRNNLDLEVFDGPMELLNELDEGNFPELILSDLMMPYMSGIELFREIKDKYQRPITFALLTSQAEIKSVVSSFDYGIQHYLLKDTGIDIIAERVFRILNDKSPDCDVQATTLTPSEIFMMKSIKREGDNVTLETPDELAVGEFLNLTFKDEPGVSLWRVVNLVHKDNKNFINLVRVYENNR